MRQKNIFRGMGVALITPFKSDSSVDYEALGAIVNAQIENGADFLCVLGTTAETPCLSNSEKQEIKDFVVNINAGRVPILLGCGGNNTLEVAHYLKTADLKGVDGVLLVCPFYNKPTQEGLFQHFKMLSEASPLPIVLYNIPGRTGINLAASTTLRIANACENIVAIKEASGNLPQMDDIIRQAPEGFEVLSGDDAITLEILSTGGAGVISVVGNTFTKEFSTMVHAIANGNRQEATTIHRRFGNLYKLLSVDGNPAGIKSLMALQGKIKNTMRLPLVPVREETREEMKKELEKLGRN